MPSKCLKLAKRIILWRSNPSKKDFCQDEFDFSSSHQYFWYIQFIPYQIKIKRSINISFSLTFIRPVSDVFLIGFAARLRCISYQLPEEKAPIHLHYWFQRKCADADQQSHHFQSCKFHIVVPRRSLLCSLKDQFTPSLFHPCAAGDMTISAPGVMKS